MITYNHENFIEEAINGVLMQECDFEIELILANDCSPDKTEKIIRDIITSHPKGSLIKYFRHKENIGMQPNVYFAVEQCKGKYIAMCEGDDYWTDPLKLQKQIDFLELNSSFVACFHKVSILEENGSIVEDYITNVPSNYQTIEDIASKGNYIHTPSVVFRNIIKEFPPEMTLSPLGDYFLYMLLAEHGNFKYIEENMAVYRNGVGVFSSQTQNSKIINTQVAFFLIWKYFQSKNEKIAQIIFNRLQLFDNKIEAVAQELYKQLNQYLLDEKVFSSFHKSSRIKTEDFNQNDIKSAINVFLKKTNVKFLIKLILFKLGFVKLRDSIIKKRKKIQVLENIF